MRLMRRHERICSLLAELFSIFVLVALDQYTKGLAVSYLKGQPSVILLDGVMELEYLENRGAAFGILQNQQGLFIALFIVVVVLAVIFCCRVSLERRYLPLRIIAVFVIAGGTGNLIDRVTQGYVVDFLYFSLINFPIFNVADIYVTVSMILLFLLLLFHYKEEDLAGLFSGCQNGGGKTNAGR